MIHLHLCLAFLRVGLLGYGGGPSSIPLVHQEVVKKYHWMDDDDFSDLLALANTLPGPIATKMAGYIGYRVSGWLGMINAVLSSILPTIFLMIVLLVSLSSIKNLSFISGMTKAVVPVVAVMLATLTWDFFIKATKGLGAVKTVIFIIVCMTLIEWIGLHPGLIIAGLILYAMFKKEKEDQDDCKEEQQ